MPLFFPQTLLFKVTKASCALLAGLAVWLALPATIADAQRAADFDIVLANGRVMDPESGLDAVRHVGIRNGKIAAVSAAPLKGKTLIDAKGLVVTAGFIDLHSHGQDDENYRYKARDGVTTALEMEVGASPVAKWYADREGKSLINFGATVGHIPARMAVMKDTGAWLPRDLAITRRATADENRQMIASCSMASFTFYVPVPLGARCLESMAPGRLFMDASENGATPRSLKTSGASRSIITITNRASSGSGNALMAPMCDLRWEARKMDRTRPTAGNPE